ncbi:MAG: butyrate kinase [Sedimentibacter sp.]
MEDNNSNIRILVVNNGSTSIKVAGYENSNNLYEVELPIDSEKIKNYDSLYDQIGIRKQAIEEYISKRGESISEYDVVACRGTSTIKGVKLCSGGYVINKDYVDMCYQIATPHASTLGPIMTYEWMQEYKILGFIYDAEGVNEFNDYATLSGHKDFPITPGSHTLNQKAAARKCAERLGGKYEDYTLIVAHLGGGTSIALHDHGELVDSTSDGFSPTRMGGMPMLGMIGYTRECFSGKYTLNQLLKMMMNDGGLVSYLGTSDLREVEQRIKEGDKEAEFYFNGMVYALAKDIGTMATVSSGKVDCIVLTGGMAYSKRLVQTLSDRVSFIAPVEVFAGSLEMEALAAGILRIMLGKEEPHFIKYKSCAI